MNARLFAYLSYWNAPAALDDFYRNATDAGAEGVIEPESTDWGGRRARLLDPQGQEWSVGTYEPGVIL